MRPLNTPYWIDFIQHILISHIKSLSKILKCPLSVKPIIVNESIPKYFLGFLSWSLHAVPYKFIALSLNHPRHIPSKKKLDGMKFFDWLIEVLIKKALEHGESSPSTNVSMLDKWLLDIIGRITPNLLHQQASKEHMLHSKDHKGATLTHLIQYLPLQSLIATTLWKFDHIKVVSFWAQC